MPSVLDLGKAPLDHLLDFDSVLREAGLYLKKRWKGKLDRLCIAHLRDGEWLKENLENPLRH